MASIAIGLEELLRMPLPTLQAVLQAGVESKRALLGQRASWWRRTVACLT